MNLEVGKYYIYKGKLVEIINIIDNRRIEYRNITDDTLTVLKSKKKGAVDKIYFISSAVNFDERYYKNEVNRTIHKLLKLKEAKQYLND